MLTFFESLLLGHFVVDYLLQNNWMALNKTKSWLACLTHCFLYSLSICLFTWTFNPWWILVVFLSHFPIDRWSLADKYLQLTRGRSLTGFIKHYDLTVDIKDEESGEITKDKAVRPCRGPLDILSGGFTTFVYIVVDNTFHILLMVGGMFLLKFLGVI